ncbi:MAG: extracellular solute-binding protein family 1 [Cohnella sp.]|nr:extracellular solute-binding protein family 1 [Cohnella sp.]
MAKRSETTKRNKKTAITLVLIMSLISILAACSGGKNDATNTPSVNKASQASQTTASEQPVELTMAQWGTADQVKATQTLLDVFTQKYPNIKVKLVYKDWGSYWTWITSQAASKDLPDVYKMSFAYVDKYAKLGAMKELDQLIADKNFDLNQFEPALLQMHQSGGKQVSLPRDANTVVLYYNKDLFDAAKLPYPAKESSWDQILELAKKLTLDNKGNKSDSPGFDPQHIKQWGIVADAAGMADAVLEPQLWSNGARLVDDNHKLALDTPEAKEVLNFFRDLSAKYHVNPPTSTIEALGGNPILAFGTGKIAMAFGGSWSATDFAKASFKFDAVFPPKFKEVKTVVQPAGYAMSPFTKKEDAAWTLLSWLVGTEGQNKMAELNDGIPANKTAADSFLSSNQGFDQKIFLAAQSYAIPSAWYEGEDRLFWEFIPQKLALPMQGKGELDPAIKEIQGLMGQ